MSEIATRRIVIGDIHGHYEGLMTLLNTITPTADDEIYFLGDLIDRGPQSSQVVEFVKSSRYHCLLGNHEQMLVNLLTNENATPAMLEAWLYSGGKATIASYEHSKVSHEHIEWFMSLPTYLDLGDIWLAHAGVDPKLSLSKQTAAQLCWIRDEFHTITKPYFCNKLIIIGHTITFTLPGVNPGQLAKGCGWLGIDTGAYHPRSGWLTAVDTTNNIVYQVNVLQHETRTLTLEGASANIKW
jgi:serine/threonine protein phosphatase 1